MSSKVVWSDAYPKYDEQRMRDIYLRNGAHRDMIEKHGDFVPKALRQMWYDMNYLLDMIETARDLQEFGRKRQ